MQTGQMVLGNLIIVLWIRNLCSVYVVIPLYNAVVLHKRRNRGHTLFVVCLLAFLIYNYEVHTALDCKVSGAAISPHLYYILSYIQVQCYPPL